MLFLADLRHATRSSSLNRHSGETWKCYPLRMRWLAAVLILTAANLLPAFGQQPGGSISVPAGARILLTAKGDGVQIYSCTATPDGAKWTLKGPDAQLLNAAGKPIGTHFAGPTWKLNGGGQVQGELVSSHPSPDPASVAWLLLRPKAGTATGTLAQVTFIRRTDTHGGMPKANNCQKPGDVGKTARVPYSATYTFYATQQ